MFPTMGLNIGPNVGGRLLKEAHNPSTWWVLWSWVRGSCCWGDEGCGLVGLSVVVVDGLLLQPRTNLSLLEAFKSFCPQNTSLSYPSWSIFIFPLKTSKVLINRATPCMCQLHRLLA